MLPNAAHLHLLLNHVPTVGFGIALALFGAGRLRANDELTRAALALFFAVAVVAVVTYVTGNAAEDLLRGGGDEDAFPAGVVPAAIRAHEDAALPAFALLELTGFAAWLALWQWRRAARLANSYFTLVLVLAVVTFGLMWRAAELGGRIHHPEIEAAAGIPAGADPAGDADLIGPSTTGGSPAGWAHRFGTDVVVGQQWVWPTLETMHFIGLCMLFAVVLLVNLRLLGLIKSVPYSALWQLMPIGVLGFGLNLISGIMFFLGAPGQYVGNVTFFWKIGLIVLGGFNVLYFLVDERVWHVNAGDEAPLASKIAAGSAICIWAAVLFCGHMLPFLGNAF